ncbi:MAG: cupin domain-containing protein [Pirellulaceae bacterium]
MSIVGDVYRFLATGEETDGKYSTWEAIVPPGGGPPPHIHRREEESFIVLEGEVTFWADGRRFTVGPGGFVGLPVGSLHCFKNEIESTGPDDHLRGPRWTRANVLRGRHTTSIGGDRGSPSIARGNRETDADRAQLRCGDPPTLGLSAYRERGSD